MRFPVKFKSEIIPSGLRAFVPNKPDPTRLLTGTVDEAAFSRCASSLCIGGIWRTTRPGRHPESNRLLSESLSVDLDVQLLDVGASDGGTSADLLACLGNRVKTMFVTDVCTKLKGVNHNGLWYLYHPDGTCIMAISKNTIFYNSPENAPAFIAGWIRRVFSDAPGLQQAREVSLMNPRLRAIAANDLRLRIQEWDVFSHWPGEKVDVVRLANLLNPAYFKRDQIRTALQNGFGALKENGWLMIVDNRSIEKSTLYHKRDGKVTIAGRVASGADAEVAFEDGWSPATYAR